jgi:tetratricopeptide (TPR) repeat protein
LKEPASPSNAVPAGEGVDHTRLLQEDLLARIEARLANASGAVELQVERAHLLAELKRPKEAAQVYREATKSRTPRYPLTSRAYSVLPYRGKTLPITVLLIVAPEWGNAPFRKYLDDQTFLTLQVIADFHDPALSPPPHQLAINCVSDADSCRTSLEAAMGILAQTQAPVINSPTDVLATSRESNARRLASIPGVRTPKTATFSREILAGSNNGAVLEQHGFSFPLLIRSPGFHTGLHFMRVESPQELNTALTDLPGENLSVIEFLDARGSDGLIRKYRVMMIDGKFYPAHAAISTDWKVHYFSSTTPDSLEHRAEDEAFLKDIPQVLGARVMETLGRIHDALKLDYAGIDFSVGVDGEILLFEANATMNVNPPVATDEHLAYRRAPVQRIAEAVRTMFFTRAFSTPNRTADSPSQFLREFTLRHIEEHLARNPGIIELQIERARLMIELGRYGDAKDVFLEILKKDPNHLVALNNLGALLNILGFYKAALKVYRQVVALNPDNLKGRTNLAHTLREAAELDEARAHYEAILQQTPDKTEVHEGLSYVLMYQGQKEAAWEHHKIAAKKRPAPIVPYDGGKALPRILLLSSPCGGNSPISRFLDQKIVHTTHLVPDFHDLTAPLPPHDLVINAIGDADHCGTSLDPLPRLLEQTTMPVINRPDRISLTGRADNARLLGTLEGVVTPRIVTLSREILAGSEGPAVLESHGFTFPILLRSPGFHEGSHFMRVENPDCLASAVASLPGPKQMAIQHLDARDDDGKIRKYRVMMIDGKLYPLHKAISQQWMIHYYTADMADSPAHRAEDEAFLVDMPSVLGTRAMQALERIRVALGLDYAGADFSLGREGQVLLFEANATMAVPTPELGKKWDFRRQPVRLIQDAVREMILSRASVR